MAARLTRFYGQSPWHWLAELPMAITRRMVDLIPRLEAEESFLASERIGIGTGSFKAGDSKQIRDLWRSRIEHEQARQRPSRTVEAVRAAGLRVFGPKRATA